MGEENTRSGMEPSSRWIFGYGSLVWKPDFEYNRRKVGFIKGYKRRFWHGDNLYRGDTDRLGRVVTLVEDQEACTWGVAYEVTGSQIEESLQYLTVREVQGGGYCTRQVEFTPREDDQGTLLALTYIATPDNPLYLGPASEEEIAAQIAVCSGRAGPNVEYLVRLAEFMKLFCPMVKDKHLFAIEAALTDLLRDREGIRSAE